MKRDLQIENLFDAIEDLKTSLRWLRRSFKACSGISNLESCSEEQYDDIEAFTSRYARTSDLLIQKVFRAIDAAEFENTGTLLDAANHAEKRGIIKDVVMLRTIREARNMVAHEYATEKLTVLFSTIINLTPELINICEDAISYCDRFKKKDK
jgi:hypothetical protein